MTTRSKAVGFILVIAAVLLPLVGWRLSVKAYYDDHNETDIEKMVDAAGAGQIAQMNALLSKGIRVAAGTEGGRAPLFAAISTGQAAAVQLLLSHGADVNQRYTLTEAETQRTKRGKYKLAWVAYPGDTPILACARTGNAEVAKILISSGADVNAVAASNSTPVFITMQGQSVDMMRVLAHAGASLDMTDTNGDTPLMWVLQRNDTKLGLEIIKMGADVDNVNLYRDTALLQTVRANLHPDIELILAQKSKDLNLKDADGYSPLSYTVSFNRLNLAETLIRRGADVNQTDNNGSTPIITAALLGETKMAQLLIGAGANARIKDKSGMTALDWAKSKNSAETISVIEQALKTGK